MPAPTMMGDDKSLLFLCSGHQRAWGVAMGMTALTPPATWASFSIGRAPIVGTLVPLR